MAVQNYAKSVHLGKILRDPLPDDDITTEIQPMLTANKTGQTFRPGLLHVELPGIEPALGDALNWENARSDDLKVRQATRKHLGERASC